MTYLFITNVQREDRVLDSFVGSLALSFHCNLSMLHSMCGPKNRMNIHSYRGLDETNGQRDIRLSIWDATGQNSMSRQVKSRDECPKSVTRPTRLAPTGPRCPKARW